MHRSATQITIEFMSVLTLMTSYIYWDTAEGY